MEVRPELECAVCRNSAGNRTFSAREMMYGRREPFDYVECAACGSLQIARVPENLGEHYPPEYGAYALVKSGPLERLGKRLRTRHVFSGFTPGGSLLLRAFGAPPYFEWLAGMEVDRSSAILEVGCGAGQLLYELWLGGFRNLLGVDPHVPRDVEIGTGLRILRAGLEVVQGRFDAAMLHHSFEHMQDPRGALRELARLVRPGGRVLLRTPVSGSHAWRTYGADWAQLDPPRHLFVCSERGLRRLAAEAGFAVSRVVYDSTSFQFYASEQYRRDIPLLDPRSYFVDPSTGLFAPETIRSFELQAAELNTRGDGDQACFYLQRL